MSFLYGIILLCNPFLIDVPPKEELTVSDYLEVQHKLQQLDITQALDDIYPKLSWWDQMIASVKRVLGQKPNLRHRQDFQGRLSRGIQQIFINPEKNQLPNITLHQINEGGEYCLVSYCSYNGIYPSLLEKIPSALQQTGFHGHLLLFEGAFPNPTGQEIRFCAVPYCFKIFALMEAHQRGFQKVLWIDSALIPLNDPTPLFHWIEEKGSLLHFRKNGHRYLLPVTRQILFKETGVDLYRSQSLRARVIGLNFQYPATKNLIQEYQRLVEMGTPFMGCFPEEFVLGALLQKHPQAWPCHPFTKIVLKEGKLHGKSQDQAQKEGYFFLLQHH